jgi:hypothetical protein
VGTVQPLSYQGFHIYLEAQWVCSPYRKSRWGHNGRITSFLKPFWKSGLEIYEPISIDCVVLELVLPDTRLRGIVTPDTADQFTASEHRIEERRLPDSGSHTECLDKPDGRGT